ncbi:hypothetical protein UFOVP221_12 [uncultured Caudovirales phage]|uniref:Uncharacterized protein n=1 Tax=uncultured Caudovirales phage TaxID=2100421 RepID=A0A6J7WLL3_9CAUD|nr:hypothetical protein UFOVP221_12 [uncultured Caudovirales phage]
MDRVMCPICEGNDQARNVGSLLTAGAHTTITAGAAFAGHGVLGISPVLLMSESTDQLTQRLTPPLTPGNLSRRFFYSTMILGGFFWSSIAAAFMVNSWGNGFNPIIWLIVSGLLYIFTEILWIPVFMVAIAIYRYSRPTARERWFAQATELYGAWYCYRDDVVFDGAVYGSPEQMVSYYFRPPKSAQLSVTR